MRIKSKWHKNKQKSTEEIAGALGFIIWRIASTTVNKMYNEGFNFSSNRQLLDVIGEFIAFLIQVADREAYERLSEEERQRFIMALASHLITTMVDNLQEELGEGDYKAAFIDTLNQRLEAYSEFNYSDGMPSYPFLRYLGTCVDAVMGGEENKWVIEQVIEVEAPDVLKTFKKGFNDLLSQNEQAVGEEGSESRDSA